MLRWFCIGLLGLGCTGAAALACTTNSDTPSPPVDAGDETEAAPVPLRTCEEDPGCPNKIQPADLKLWLKGDEGIACDTSTTPAHVTQWTDQSGAQHSASPHVGFVGPRCGVATIKGLPVVSFRPAYGTDGSAVLDETLDVDLSWLTLSEYTIFVVERRTTMGVEMGLITTEYNSFTGATAPGCPADAAAPPGYIELSWALPFSTKLTSTHNCGTALTGVHTYEGETAPPSIVMSMLSKKFGRTLSVDGTELKRATGDTAGVLISTKVPQFSGGIGRTHNARLDHRYSGDIAEIVAYDVALSSADELAVLQYLYLKWK